MAFARYSQRGNRSGEFGDVTIILIPTDDKAYLTLGPVVKVKTLSAQARGFANALWSGEEERAGVIGGAARQILGRLLPDA